MNNFKNLFLQILYNSDSERVSQTNALYSFSQLMNCHCSMVDDGYRESFVVSLSDDDLEFCHQINAFAAFCYFHGIAMKLESYPQ